MDRPRLLAVTTVVPVALAVCIGSVVTSSRVNAAEPQSSLVTDVPATNTPRVVGGQCYGSVSDPTLCRKVSTMVKIGSWIYAGGIIDKVARTDGTGVQPGFSNLFRFDAVTKVVDQSFQPQFFRTAGSVYDGPVDGLAASADGSMLYVGGEFTTVKSSGSSASVVRKGIAAVSTATGAIVTAFDAKVCQGGGNCVVNDVRMIGSQLVIGGSFSKVAKQVRNSLASLEPSTGALTRALTLSVTGRPVAPTPTKVARIKPNPSGTKAVIIGNFDTVGTQTRKEVAVLDFSGAAATLDSWNAPASLDAAVTTCNKKHYWPRDTDWSPDGSYFVIVGTGGGGGHPYPAPCDAYTRWADDGNPDSVPLGYNHTEIDTVDSVCSVGKWTYVGGHFKSLNQEVRSNGVKVKPPAGTVNETHYGMGVIDNTTSLAVTGWNHSDQTGRGEGWTSVLCIPGPAAQGGGVYFGGDSIGVNGNPKIQRLAYFPASS